MSAMPGMCLDIADGGVGFDFRLSMGIPDLWIKMLKESRDEDWDMDKLWYELNIRRPKEKNIGYAESHDQALVGDKTIMFRLCDADMYSGMNKFGTTLTVERGVALHKMIRLITSTLAGEGYLNFMGNEFGHPEWIDFPREGNDWSYHYCRRQWNLVDNTTLRYCELNNFDIEMIHFLRRERLLTKKTICQYIHQDDKIIIYTKGKLAFAFNFHPSTSFDNYFIRVEEEGKYRVVLSTDDRDFGGHNRVNKEAVYEAKMTPGGWIGFQCYLPTRCAIAFKKI
jgi:1,4-alpha-glucan branching enzyme